MIDVPVFKRARLSITLTIDKCIFLYSYAGIRFVSIKLYEKLIYGYIICEKCFIYCSM